MKSYSNQIVRHNEAGDTNTEDTAEDNPPKY